MNKAYTSADIQTVKPRLITNDWLELSHLRADAALTKSQKALEALMVKLFNCGVEFVGCETILTLNDDKIIKLVGMMTALFYMIRSNPTSTRLTRVVFYPDQLQLEVFGEFKARISYEI